MFVVYILFFVYIYSLYTLSLYHTFSILYPQSFSTGNQEDESRFVHPMFVGFNLSKKALTPQAKALLDKTMTKRSSQPNPYRYDPKAAKLGNCPVCADGSPGCPRCFMLPLRPDGSIPTLAELAFDPELERRKRLELDAILLRQQIIKSRKMKVRCVCVCVRMYVFYLLLYSFTLFLPLYPLYILFLYTLT